MVHRQMERRRAFFELYNNRSAALVCGSSTILTGEVVVNEGRGGKRTYPTGEAVVEVYGRQHVLGCRYHRYLVSVYVDRCQVCAPFSSNHSWETRK